MSRLSMVRAQGRGALKVRLMEDYQQPGKLEARTKMQKEDLKFHVEMAQKAAGCARRGDARLNPALRGRKNLSLKFHQLKWVGGPGKRVWRVRGVGGRVGGKKKGQEGAPRFELETY